MRPALRLACALLPALLLSAQDPGFNGVWKHASDSGIPAAIEDNVKDMNFIKRPIARKKLTDKNPVYQKVTITAGAQEISIQFDARSPVKMPADGKAVPWTREDGDKFMVSAKVEGNRLTQHFKSEEGERTNVFTLGGDRKLGLSVTVKSPSLNKPLTYTMQFTGA
jgi:hypothetical protein